jgi:glucose 1-dehydrogenase
MQNLNGQVAIVSGALGDIGRAIALELARRGADVAVGDILEPTEAEGLLTGLRQMGRKARYDTVDVSDWDAVTQWIADTEADLGMPTLIVPNAAIVVMGRIYEVTPEQWRRQMAVNLDGAFFMAQAAVQRLLHHGRPGRIVFIGSWVAHTPRPHIPAYCVSKAGLRMLCKCMALELAPRGILVNEVAPGNVDAGLSARLFAEDPALRDPHIAMVPVGRLMSAEEVALQVAHLCDPANQQMTGSTLLMDGGLSLLSDRGAH